MHVINTRQVSISNLNNYQSGSVFLVRGGGWSKTHPDLPSCHSYDAPTILNQSAGLILSSYI